MRFLFILNTLGMLRHLGTAVDTLLERGHDVTLAITERGETGLKLPQRLDSHPRLRLVAAPAHRTEALRLPGRILRSLRDCLFYQTPAYRDAHALRRRAFERMLEVTSGGTRTLPDDPAATWLDLNGEQTRRLGEFFDVIEDQFPSDPLFERFIQACRPDVVLITPLIPIGSNHPDYLKAAKRLGLPTGFPVFSWDNLSSKGALHVKPDRVFVWNEIQKREAVDLHGVDPDSVVVTGASRFDEFFEMQPSVDRAEFCERYALNPSEAIVFYLGSSPFVSPDERGFVRAWLHALRSSTDTRIARANVVIRPHPRALSQWESADSPPIDDPGARVVTSNRMDSEPLLFDCLYHADAVVALNTSAQIEAAILGKPIYTISAPDSAPGQLESLHFRYLLRGHGGCVELAADFPEHLRQLGRAVKGEYDREALRAFVAHFVRPYGLDRPATPIVADAFEALHAAGTRRRSNAGPVGTFVQKALGRIGGRWSAPDPTDQPPYSLVDPVERRRSKREHTELKELRRQVRTLKRELSQRHPGDAGAPDHENKA